MYREIKRECVCVEREREIECTVVAHMLVTVHKNYSMIYAYAVSFIGCIDIHN